MTRGGSRGKGGIKGGKGSGRRGTPLSLINIKNLLPPGTREKKRHGNGEATPLTWPFPFKESEMINMKYHSKWRENE